MMSSVDFWGLVVIGGFQCAKPGHTLDFRKPARTEAVNKDVSGEPGRMVTLTQSGHPFVGRRNEYQLKGSDALRLGSVEWRTESKALLKSSAMAITHGFVSSR